MNFHDSLGRFFGIAVIDVVGTVVIAYLIAKYWNYSFLNVLIVLLVLGEAMHIAFDQSTPITRLVLTP